LIGDASGSADAVTGQGLASAFREARLLADALSRDCIADYESGHAKILRHPQTMAAAMLAMDRWPKLRELAMCTFAEHPHLFARLMEVHGSEESATAVAVAGAAQLGFHLLKAGIQDGFHYGARSQSASHGLASVTAESGEFASSEAALFESCRKIA